MLRLFRCILCNNSFADFLCQEMGGCTDTIMGRCTHMISLNRRYPVLFFMFLVLAVGMTDAETFRYRFRDGERYRILSQIDQNVYLNGAFQHSAELLNRIQVEVLETRGDSGREQVYYQHSVEARRNSTDAYQLDREYSAEFWRNSLGKYDISDEYFVPTVRDVPMFPDRDVQPGETWSAPGYEVHDLRQGFNIREVFSFPMPVSYEYRGPVTMDGKELHHIVIRYNIFHRKSIPPGNPLYPYLITGYSDQNLYFDNILGRPHSYEEDYEIMLHLSDGSTVTYEGSASAEVIESPELDRDALKDDLRQRLSDLGVEDSSVRDDEDGVTISLENIQFPPDSSRLVASEQAKIRKIAEILSAYPNRDILVSGHTALAGTEAGRQRLSEQRAAAVVEYLIDLGARDRSRIMFQGFGATRPVADNDTPAGMRRNRRVEITILEN